MPILLSCQQGSQEEYWIGKFLYIPWCDQADQEDWVLKCTKGGNCEISNYWEFVAGGSIVQTISNKEHGRGNFDNAPKRVPDLHSQLDHHPTFFLFYSSGRCL